MDECAAFRAIAERKAGPRPAEEGRRDEDPQPHMFALRRARGEIGFAQLIQNHKGKAGSVVRDGDFDILFRPNSPYFHVCTREL